MSSQQDAPWVIQVLLVTQRIKHKYIPHNLAFRVIAVEQLLTPLVGTDASNMAYEPLVEGQSTGPRAQRLLAVENRTDSQA